METEYTIKIKLNEWQALEALCKALNCEAVLDPDKELKIEKGYVWIKERKIGDYALPRLVEKLLESLPSINPLLQAD